MNTQRLWIAFDCETTGFLPEGHLIEIAAILFTHDGDQIDEFHSLVAPPTEIPEFIRGLTGISTEMVEDANAASKVLQEFASWLHPLATIIAHNVAFDIGILAKEMPVLIEGIPNLAVDSLRIARTLGVFQNNKLKTIGNALRSDQAEYHRAMTDAHVVKDLLLYSIKHGLEFTHPKLFQGRSLQSVLDDSKQ